MKISHLSIYLVLLNILVPCCFSRWGGIMWLCGAATSWVPSITLALDHPYTCGGFWTLHSANAANRICWVVIILYKCRNYCSFTIALFFLGENCNVGVQTTSAITRMDGTKKVCRLGKYSSAINAKTYILQSIRVLPIANASMSEVQEKCTHSS